MVSNYQTKYKDAQKIGKEPQILVIDHRFDLDIEKRNRCKDQTTAKRAGERNREREREITNHQQRLKKAELDWIGEMGYSDSSSSIGGVWCKKHPRHKQSPGVCSCCLREKLSFHLNSSSSFSSIHSSSVISSSPSYSSSPDQTSSPPPPIHHQNQTTTNINNKGPDHDDDDQISSTTASRNLDEYRRSQSSGGGIDEGSVRKKKGGAGFLLKYLKPTTKKCSRMVCMMQHSKTMNEARTKGFY